jgi:predicted DNA-binding transcriptional regulator YafY
MRRADRLFQLVHLLRRRRVRTARQLAEALEVSERTVYRDVADLQASGVRISGEAGVGYALDAGFELPPLTFTERELEALALGARVVQSWADPELAQAARGVLRKVEAALPEGLSDRLAAAPLFAPGFHVPREAARHLPLLREAIRGRQKLALAYVDRAEAGSARTVWPLGLAFWGRGWSVATWCELRGGFRGFRLDRIRHLRPTGERFPLSPGRTLEDFLRQVSAPPLAARDGPAAGEASTPERPMRSTASASRASSWTSASRTLPSPVPPKPLPGTRATPARSSTAMAKSREDA